jgi:hypothetical protein
VLWVADRGFASQENRRYLQRAGGHYILGERLRSGSEDIRHPTTTTRPVSAPNSQLKRLFRDFATPLTDMAEILLSSP